MLDSEERQRLAEIQYQLAREDPRLARLLSRGLPRRRARLWLALAAWVSWSAAVVTIAVVGWVALALLVLPTAALTALGWTVAARWIALHQGA